jgi:uncharacterized protein YjbI with pentapeptide repeats
MSELRDLDWYGEDLGAVAYSDVTFVDVDLSETITRGASFERCVFHNCRFNASTHINTAFVSCELRRCNLFDVILDGCKLTGSELIECTLRPMAVRSGVWRGVTIRRGSLTGLELDGLDLRDADLSLSDLTGSSLRGADLSGAVLRETNLNGVDLRGANLTGVDLSTTRLKDTRLDLVGAVLLAEQHGALVDASG